MPNPPSDLLQIASELHHSSARLSRVLRAARPPEGLSMSKLSVLEHLYREGASTATVLAGYLRMQPQSLTRLLDYLERRKLIVRKVDEADRRRSRITITEGGTRVLKEDVHARRVHLAEAMEAALTPVERELLRLAAGLMERVADATQSQRNAAAPRARLVRVK